MRMEHNHFFTLMDSRIKHDYYLQRVDLSIDQVVDFEWNRLAFRMFERQLSVSERNFIKRLRKRERNLRKYHRELKTLSITVQSLEFEKQQLKFEKQNLEEEIQNFEKLFYYQIHCDTDIQYIHS